jgi:RNA polymerase sigma-70 factor, ECF subfamily
MDDDASLIPLAAAGDRAAFRALVERHRTMVYRVAFQYCGNHHDADDIAQDVFLKVFRSLASFRQDAQFTSWLYRIAMNACIDHARRTAPLAAAASVDDEEINAVDTVADATPGPEDRAYGGELGHVLRSEIERLPPRQRLIFTMRHFEELKLSEIADALDLAEGTVKRQLHAAVHRLRGALRSSLTVRTAERPRRLQAGEIL